MPEISIDGLEYYRLLDVVTKTYRTIERLQDAYDKFQREYDHALELFNEIEDARKFLLYEQLRDELYEEIEDEKECFLYYILNDEKNKVKIGISSNPIKRARSIQTSSGEEIELLHTISFENRKMAMDAESFLHKRFSEYRKRPSKVARTTEWFDSIIVKKLMNIFDTREKILHAKEKYEKQIVEEFQKVKIL